MFIARLSTGETIVEENRIDASKPSSWDILIKRMKEESFKITSLQILHKPTGICHTLRKAHDKCQFFCHTVRQKVLLGNATDEEMNKLLGAKEIGMIFNSNGDCVVMRVFDKDGHVQTSFENAKKIGLNYDLHGVKLEEI